MGLGIAALALAPGGGPVMAQVRTIDPNQAIDGDLPPATQSQATTQARAAAAARARQAVPAYQAPAYQAPAYQAPAGTSEYDRASAASDRQAAPVDAGSDRRETPAQRTDDVQQTRAEQTTDAANTYQRDDLLSAGEGVFGKGAAGFAGIIEKILRSQGRPNAYIAGHEAAGAFIIGLRYGSGIMTHKVEGQMPVFWTGPSIGFDAGGDADKVFVLVYNLYDTADLYHRFPQVEGASVLRRRVRGDVSQAGACRADPDPAGGRVPRGGEPWVYEDHAQDAVAAVLGEGRRQRWSDSRKPGRHGAAHDRRHGLRRSGVEHRCGDKE